MIHNIWEPVLDKADSYVICRPTEFKVADGLNDLRLPPFEPLEPQAVVDLMYNAQVRAAFLAAKNRYTATVSSEIPADPDLEDAIDYRITYNDQKGRTREDIIYQFEGGRLVAVTSGLTRLRIIVFYEEDRVQVMIVPTERVNTQLDVNMSRIAQISYDSADHLLEVSGNNDTINEFYDNPLLP